MNRESIEEILKSIGSEDVPAEVRKIARETSRDFSEPLMRPGQHIFLEYIMKSQITKLAAAAVIIIAVMLGVYNLIGDGTSVALAQVMENVKKMPWMHIVGETEGQQREYWVSYPQGIIASKHSSGKIMYHEKDTLYVYYPSSETLTISLTNTNNDAFEFIGQSPTGFIETVKKIFIETGGEIVEDETVYHQKNAMVYRMHTKMETGDVAAELIVESIQNLPVFFKQDYFDANSNSVKEAKLYFDYPAFGPVSIYDIGVPRAAKVVNNLPAEEIPQLLEKYQLHRDNSPSRYIAVVTNEWFNQDTNASVVHRASIIYREGTNQRVEYYGVHRDNWVEYNKNWHKYENEMGETFETLFSWWTQNEMSLLTSVDLYDGTFQYQLRFDNGKLKSLPRVYAPKGELQADNDLADFGWDVDLLALSSSDTHSSGLVVVVKNEYSKKNNLICIENKTQGRIITDRTGKVWAVPPSRKAYYLNPQRDYICQRFEQEEMLDAFWQQDKEWLNRIKQEHIDSLNSLRNRVRQVTEFAQTEQGLWYPNEIVTWDPTNTDDSDRIKKIWLRTDLEFPEGIFDPKNLPE